MRLHALVYFYGRRLRTHPIQEVLAGAGIAIGVALAFAVMVANSSVVASAEETVRGVTGTADLQLTARSSSGFDEQLLEQVHDLPGVDRAAPVLERRAVLVKGDREVAVNLVSVDPALAGLSGRLVRSFVPGGLQLSDGGLMLPNGAATELGIPNPATEAGARPLPTLGLHLRGAAYEVRVAAVLGRDTIGSLTGAKAAVMPLLFLQQLAGLEGRVTRILVDAMPGRERAVRDGLDRLAAGRLNVAPAHADVGLLRQATGPTDQVTRFFAAISALLGLLLAFNAMLLTAPERRRLVSALRMQGYLPRQIVALVLFQATVLGLVASIVGVVGGIFLAHGLFDKTPDYLAPGFTLGSHTIVGVLPVALAVASGVIISCLAAAPPLLDLRRGRAVDAVFHDGGAPGNALGVRARRGMLAGSTLAFAIAAPILVWVPEAALAASALLALGTLLAIPMAFAAVVRLMDALISRVPRLSTLTVALLAMRATTLRSLALAATGAVAVYGSVAMAGARDDLFAGIGQYTADYVGTADVWVASPADNQATNDFRPKGLVGRVERVRGVRDVRIFRAGFLDFDGRRVWTIARPRTDSEMLPSSSMVDGDLAVATRRLRRGGWVALSEHIARDHGAELGGTIDLPTPSGRRDFRVAATISNLGWAPGAVILNARDYRSAWGEAMPTAMEVDVDPGSSPALVAGRIERALGAAGRGLRVQTAPERAAQIGASASQGLARLDQIVRLLQAAAVLAMAAAMGAAIWQRRPALAALRIQSFKPRQLWMLLVVEASIVLGAGGLTGAVTGVFGQLGADRFLEIVTGFPVAPGPAGWHTVQTFAVVVLTALAIVAVPGWFAARVQPRLGLGTE